MDQYCIKKEHGKRTDNTSIKRGRGKKKKKKKSRKKVTKNTERSPIPDALKSNKNMT